VFSENVGSCHVSNTFISLAGPIAFLVSRRWSGRAAVVSETKSARFGTAYRQRTLAAWRIEIARGGTAPIGGKRRKTGDKEVKPEHYHKLDEQKICHNCYNNDSMERDGVVYYQWCHLYFFECSPVGSCFDWEAEK